MHQEAVGAGGLHGEALGTVETGVERDAPGRAGGEADHDGFVGCTDERLAGEVHAVLFVVEPADSFGEIEGAPVVFDPRGVGGSRGGGVREREAEVTEGLVAAERGVGAGTFPGAFARAGEVGVYEGLRLVVFPFEQEAADFG